VLDNWKGATVESTHALIFSVFVLAILPGVGYGMLRLRESYSDKNAELLRIADMRLSVRDLTLMSIAGGALGFALGFFVLKLNPLANLILALCGLFIPHVYLVWRADSRLRAFDLQLAETMQNVRYWLAIGGSLVQCVERIVRETPDEPTQTEFRRVLDEYASEMNNTDDKMADVHIKDALNSLYQRMPVFNLRLFLQVLTTHREIGGNKAEMLGNIIPVIHQRQKMAYDPDPQIVCSSLHRYVFAVLAAISLVQTVIFPGYFAIPDDAVSGHVALGFAYGFLTIIALYRAAKAFSSASATSPM